MVLNRSSKTDEQIIKLIMTLVQVFFSRYLSPSLSISVSHLLSLLLLSLSERHSHIHFMSFKLMTHYFRSDSSFFHCSSLQRILNWDTSNGIVIFNLIITRLYSNKLPLKYGWAETEIYSHIQTGNAGVTPAILADWCFCIDRKYAINQVNTIWMAFGCGLLSLQKWACTQAHK